MQLIVNGQKIESKASTLMELLTELGLETQKVVAELNTQIVLRENFAQADLHEGDQIELVQFVGGG